MTNQWENRIRSDNGRLQMACGWGKLHAVKILLNRGVDPNVRENRTTPLLMAITGRPENIIQLLLARGAKVEPANGQCSFLEIPLHYAAFHGERAIVEQLLAAGADPNLHDNHGQHALWPLVHKFELADDDVAVARLLLEAGADPNVPKRDGEFPLDAVLRTLALRRKAAKTVTIPPKILTALQRYYATVSAGRTSSAPPRLPLPGRQILRFLAKTYDINPNNKRAVRETVEQLRSTVERANPAPAEQMVQLLKQYKARRRPDAGQPPPSPLHYFQQSCGKARVPALLQKLYTLAETLQRQRLDLTYLNLTLSNAITDHGLRPPHCVPFASGMNGTHFAFLVDEKKALTLAHAPIVMYGPDVIPAARARALSLRDFLSLLITVRDTTLLDQVDSSPGCVSDYEEACAAEEPKEWKKILALCSTVTQELGIKPVQRPDRVIAQSRRQYRSIEAWDPEP